MIYTGYFHLAQNYKYQAAGLTPVSIARGTPSWFKGARLTELAPNPTLLHRYKQKLITEEQYKKEYLYQLDSLRWGNILKVLHEYNCEDTILLCYEPPSKFCHRHILAEYLTENTDFYVSEYLFNKD